LKPTNQTTKLTLIVAVSENNVIGKDNELVWRLKNDLKRFKELTSGHCIIMGRKTFESFPDPLPNRTHIVITRQPNYKVPEGVIVVNSLEDAIEASKQDLNPYIIGGGEIYKQALNFVDLIELTRVHQTFEGDVFFPEIDDKYWEESKSVYNEKDEIHQYPFSFITYKKR
jgi:dihydrofolate reductase